MKYTFKFIAEGNVYTSKPIEANDEQEAAKLLKDQFEAYEGVPCEIISTESITK